MDRSKLAYAIWPWGTKKPEQIEKAAKEVAEIGYTQVECAKNVMYTFDWDLEAYKEVLDRYNVKTISFFFGLGNREADADVFKNLEKELEFAAALDVKRVCLQGTSFRPDNSKPDDMPQDALNYELDIINRFANISKDFGITPCLHPHHNTWFMFEKEIDYIMANTDPELVKFAPDVAHLIAADADPVKVIRKHADRVGFTHLKDFPYGTDIGSMGFSRSSKEIYSNFSELGKGNIDFPEIFKILDSVNYDGYYCIEQDKAPSSNAESALNNMKYLESIL